MDLPRYNREDMRRKADWLRHVAWTYSRKYPNCLPKCDVPIYAHCRMGIILAVMVHRRNVRRRYTNEHTVRVLTDRGAELYYANGKVLKVPKEHRQYVRDSVDTLQLIQG